MMSLRITEHVTDWNCPSIRAVVRTFLTAVSVALLLACPAFGQQLARIPVSVRTVYDPAVRATFTTLQPGPSTVIVYGGYGYVPRSDDAHPARHAGHGHHSDHIRHAEQREYHEDRQTGRGGLGLGGSKSGFEFDSMDSGDLLDGE